MKTFESRFKEEFKVILAKFIDDEIVVSNDLSHEPLKNNPDAIVAVIKTGLGQASNISNFDLINTTFTINFLVEANKLQRLLGALTSLVWNYNAEWANLTIPIYDLSKNELEDKLYIYRPVFTTPTQLGGISKLATAKRTIDVAIAMLNIAVGYSSNADLSPDKFELSIDNERFKMNPLRYDMTSAPIYEPVSFLDKDYINQQKTNENMVFRFVFLKTVQGRDEFLDILTEEWTKQENYLSGKKLKLIRYSQCLGEDEADIQSYILEEIYENGMKSIVLTLTR